MQRIRTIKPDFFKHENLFDAEVETGLPLRLAFAALWTCCDREGRFEWRPRALKTDCLPYDDVDFGAVLDALARFGFVIRYEVDGKPYGAVPSWGKHQAVNQREAASKIPPHIQDVTVNASADDDDAHARTCITVQARGEREREREEGSVTNVTGSEAAAPVDFTKEVFDRGVAFLEKYGTPPKQARALIGKWRKDSSDTETFNALRDANREGVTEPVAWITARLRKSQNADLNAIFNQIREEAR
jgi:hypothetical protein